MQEERRNGIRELKRMLTSEDEEKEKLEGLFSAGFPETALFGCSMITLSG